MLVAGPEAGHKGLSGIGSGGLPGAGVGVGTREVGSGRARLGHAGNTRNERRMRFGFMAFYGMGVAWERMIRASTGESLPRDS